MQSLTSLNANYMEVSENIKKLSPNTLKACQIDLKQSKAVCIIYAEHLAKKDMIKRYIMLLKHRFVPRSVKRKIACIRAFYHDLSINGVLKKNPFDQIQI